ncbi:membrane glycosyltransferase [Natronocella acetinitrilica]|uniref:Glucans biosynthesis glucosyltransferase H n=1 Tax=Natronocella acetinitrilica TaxID=414046 RepID=A0AAE3KCQ4_9GAMM|nr:glucans biosynthesis glucosyltransferase MdoH [Natronocella acetinitrilica]MCP1676026.1 membrane glycosyltransferase [Natronocella acetinitrilica]
MRSSETQIQSSAAGLHAPETAAPIRIPGKGLRPALIIGLATITTLSGVWMMFNILAANGFRAFDAMLLLLFAVSFCWISIAFWTSAAGFLLQLLRRDPLTLQRTESGRHRDSRIVTRTAVVMPVYNEETRRMVAGFEATLRSLEATGEAAHFDFYMLSDTTDPQIAQSELDAWQHLLARLGPAGERVFYRRRPENSARKVGNLADFCTRWGRNYEHMIVLDADSVMSGDCLLQLVRAMQANPRAGLIQTVPIPVQQTTFFGRFVQFAAGLYSPMLATGLSFWQTDTANYWGHNAILRVRAFIDCCGLPTLPGKAPFGGEILSHDFVEAALLRRAGWEAYLLADLEGSYEEVPCNLIDFAKRDRRWVQGNIQHLGLLGIAGLNGTSRLHFLFGALAYMASLIWFAMLVLSTVDALSRAIQGDVYFPATHQLFPDWPVVRTELIVMLIQLTIAMLLLPKVMGITIAIIQRRPEFGGTWAIVKGGLAELLFAIVIAPIMMAFHAFFVVSVLLGFGVNWETQERAGRLLSWKETLTRTWRIALTALAWGALTFHYTPVIFWWLTPALFGLVLAAPIARYSSSPQLGAGMRRIGVFLCPSEVRTDPVLQCLQKLLTVAPVQSPVQALPPALPAEIPSEMKPQDFNHKPIASGLVDKSGPEVWPPAWTRQPRTSRHHSNTTDVRDALAGVHTAAADPRNLNSGRN